MKRISLLLLLVVLIGCQSTEAGSEKRFEKIGLEQPDSQITIFKDNKTGCQYMNINAGYGQALEPILNKEGKPYCE